MDANCVVFGIRLMLFCLLFAVCLLFCFMIVCCFVFVVFCFECMGLA